MAAIALILLITAASAIVIGYVVAARRAGQAADLAAVSAAQTVEFGEPGCLIAERIAHNNGARIVTCDHVGDTIEFAITVVVEVDLGSGRLPGLPTTVPGRASAGRTENAT